MPQLAQIDPNTGKRKYPVRKQEARKRIPAFTQEQVQQACKELIEENIENNSTKFSVLFQGVLLPPKKVIARAVKIATGEELSIREFSGGEESNSKLRKAGLEVVLKADYLRGASIILAALSPFIN